MVGRNEGWLRAYESNCVLFARLRGHDGCVCVCVTNHQSKREKLALCRHNPTPHTSTHLPAPFAQVAITLTLTRVLGKLFAYIKQPQVIGEIVAGGWYWVCSCVFHAAIGVEGAH